MPRIAILQSALPVLLAACASAPVAKVAAPAPPAPAGPVKVELYVMSQCPYGIAAENALEPVVGKLGKDVELALEFVGTIDHGGELISMHGPDEVLADIIQICAAKAAPARILEFTSCLNADPRHIGQGWVGCAGRMQLPVEQIRACVEGAEGKQLLGASFQRSLARGVRASPTLYIAGQPYTRKRTAEAYTRAICAGLAKKPKTCTDLPPLPTVNVVALTDSRCPDCDAAQVRSLIATRLENPAMRDLDYARPDGKALYESLGDPSLALPVLVFDSTLDGDPDALQVLERGLLDKAGHRVLPLGGSWYPTCADSGGCERPQCRQTLTCRKATPGTLEVFVMSMCPFGVKALDSMKDVLAAFGNKIDFRVHFIGDAADGQLESMHGPSEVEEDLREACAMKHYPKDYQWMAYVLCRNKDIRTGDWRECTRGGIDDKVLSDCVDGEGRQLLEQDFKYSKLLGIAASPTWLANGKVLFHGIDAQTVQQAFCAQNKGLSGCEKKLPGESDAPAPAGCD